jgi:hypothetical protein
MKFLAVLFLSLSLVPQQQTGFEHHTPQGWRVDETAPLEWYTWRVDNRRPVDSEPADIQDYRGAYLHALALLD